MDDDPLALRFRSNILQYPVAGAAAILQRQGELRANVCPCGISDETLGPLRWVRFILWVNQSATGSTCVKPGPHDAEMGSNTDLYLIIPLYVQLRI